jgi:hypothetical protein
MKLTTIIVTLLLIGGFTMGIGGFYGALIAGYGTSDNNPLSSATMNMTNRTFEKIQGMTGSLDQNQSTTGGTITSDAPTNLITNAFIVGSLILQTPELFSSLISDLTGISGVPTWVGTMVWGIISVIIIFAFIEFITGRQTQD